MKTRAFLILATFGLGIAAFPADSHAGDVKLYNGGQCQVTDSALIHKDGWAYNNSSSTTLTVDCPTARDSASSASLTVYAIDRHYTGDIGCYAASLTTGSGGTPWWGWWTAVSYSSGTSTNMQALSLGSISGNSTSFLYLTCTIPPLYSGNKSGIFGYYVNET